MNMDRKTDDRVNVDEEVTLEMQGETFIVPKNILIEKCEYFKAKFGGAFKDSTETCLKYPDIPAAAFRLLHLCLLGKAFSTDDIQFPGIETAFKISEFFCADVFRAELKKTLLMSWEKTADPFQSLLFAENVYSESKELLEKRCIEVAHSIMHNVIHFQPCLSYQLMLHAVQKEQFVNSGVFHDSYRFSDCCVNSIKMIFAWLISNSFAPSKLLHLVKYLRLEMFPPMFPRQALINLKTKDVKEEKSKKQLEDILIVNFTEVINTLALHFDSVYILSSSYNYSKFCTADVVDINSFSPKSLIWQTDKVQIAAGSRVIHVHIIEEVAYLITSKSLDIIDMNTVQLKKSIKDEVLIRFLNLVWTYEIQIITCHDERAIYIIPEEQKREIHNSVCPVIEFEIGEEKFSTLPYHSHPDIIIAVLCFEDKVYFAGLSDSLIIYRFDSITKIYSVLCVVDENEVLGSSVCQSENVCFGIWKRKLYVFCFSSLKTTYFMLDPDETIISHAKIVSLMDKHFTKCWRFTKPYLCHVRDGFLIALQIHDCMPDPYSWNDILLTLFSPQTEHFQLLGFLPRLKDDTGGRFGFGIRPHVY